MRKTEHNLLYLNVAFCVSLVLSTILASKLVILGNHFIVPSAVVVYAVTFLCTDIIGEIWGKEEANRTVKIGFIAQVVCTLLIQLAIWLPIAPFMKEFQQVFESVLSGSVRVTIASLIGYVVAQANDVFIFHKLKDINKGKHKWIRNNVSTICSQFLDTAIFITVAFYAKVPDLFVLIYSQFFIKVILALCDTPFFYYLTRKHKD